MLNTHLYIFFAAIINCHGIRVTEVNGVETQFAQENEEVTIECQADFDVAYCGFLHPSGKQILIPTVVGRCSYKTNMTAADNGQWRCHIGHMGSPGNETIKIINVQVTSQLAAMQKTVSKAHGEEATLSCMTVDRAPLKFCQFEPPAGKPFSIDSDVTQENAILQRYYFPPNKSLDRGDCAVSIRKVKHEDVGQWICSAGLQNGREHLTTIQLQAKSPYILQKESVIAFGAVGIVAFLGILGLLLRKRCVRSVPIETVIPDLPPNIRIPTIVVQSPSPTRLTDCATQRTEEGWCDGRFSRGSQKRRIYARSYYIQD